MRAVTVFEPCACVPSGSIYLFDSGIKPTWLLFYVALRPRKQSSTDQDRLINTRPQSDGSRCTNQIPAHIFAMHLAASTQGHCCTAAAVRTRSVPAPAAARAPEGYSSVEAYDAERLKLDAQVRSAPAVLHQQESTLPPCPCSVVLCGRARRLAVQ